MLYKFETELLNNKFVFFALLSIYGIGKYHSFFVCKKVGFAGNLKIKNLTKKQITKLVKTIESLNILLASDLKKFKFLAIKKLIDINSYKGLRKKQKLPVRGQRTHTNARTVRKVKI